MNAKEERARNLEIHKMTRTHNELSKHNAALESECNQLRSAIKQTSEKYATAHDAISKRHAAAMEAEREKMNALLCQFDKERESWTERANKDSVAERMRHLDALNDIKRQFDTMYNEKMNANQAAHDATMQQLAEEREQTKRDAQEQLARLNEDRQQVKRELDETRQRTKQELGELHARIKRDEQEHMMRMLFEMDSDREKMKCQLEKEREELAEQFRKDDIEKRQASDNELTELKRQMDSNLSELDAAMQQLNEDREKLKQQEEELVAQDRERHKQLKKKEEEQEEHLCNQLEQLKKKEEENEEQLKKKQEEHEEQLKKNDEEQEEQLKKKEEEHEEQLKKKEEQLKKKKEEHEEQLKKKEEQLKKKNEEQEEQLHDRLKQLRKKEEDQNEHFIKHVKLINDERSQMKQQLHEERDQIKRDEREQHVQFLMQIKSEREKMKCQFEKEREHLAEQARNNGEAQRKFNADALAEARRTMEDNFNTMVNENRAAHDAAMQKLNYEREQLKLRFDELCERNKRNDLEHEKIKELQLELKNEKERVAEQAKKDAEAQRQSNTDALAEAKQMLDNRFNTAMQKLNEERDQIKQNDLMREKEHTQLAEQTKKDAAAQRKSNTDALASANRELETRFNAAMQQLNDDRDQIKRRLNEEQERNKRDKLEREKMHAMHRRLEQDRVNLMEQAHKDDENQRKFNAEALAEAKRQQDARFNAMMTEQRGAFDIVMQKLTDERDQLKQHDTNLNESFHKKLQELQRELEREREKLAVQARKDDETQRKFNADVLAEAKRDQDDRFNATMNEHLIAFDASMRELKDERKQLKRKLDDENNEIMSQQKIEFDVKMQQLNEERELIQKRLEEAREQTIRADLEIEKMRLVQRELAKERHQMIAERSLLAEERNEVNCKQQQQAGLVASLINEVEQLKTQSREQNEKHARTNNELKRRLDVEKPIAESLHDAVTSNYAHLQLILGIDFKDKRVVIYSHYSELDEVESYNLLTIECIQHYFDYVIILTNCPNKWKMHAPNYNKCHLLNYNMKSDFRNYGVFIMQMETNLVNASRMCLINDSFVVVDVNAFGRCIKRLFENETMAHDFIGLTSSYEGVYHLQSYFICFGGATLPDVMTYFKTRGLPMNHDAAISKYELGISLNLIDKGFTSHAVVTNKEMRQPLNTTCCMWSNVLEETGIIKRQHFLKKYAYAAMTDSDIAEVADNYSYNKHLMHFLKYNKIYVKSNDM